MDGNNNVLESGHGVDERGVVRALKRIVPDKWDVQRLQWLYRCMMTRDYAFDDVAAAVGPDAFLSQLFAANCEWYEIGDVGLICVSAIVPNCNAIVHYVEWGEIEPRELIELQYQLFDDLFTRLKLNRITAYIPAFNKQAIRMATLTGFKFEGDMRKIYLKNGIYHNLQIYGLLKEEFYERKVRN